MANLTKAQDDKVIAGVCGGLAREWDIDPTLFRIIYVVLTLLTALAVGIILYLVLMIVMD